MVSPFPGSLQAPCLGSIFFFSPILTRKMSELTSRKRVFHLCQKYMQFFKNQLKNLAFLFICKKKVIGSVGFSKNGLSYRLEFWKMKWRQSKWERGVFFVAREDTSSFPKRRYEGVAILPLCHRYSVGERAFSSPLLGISLRRAAFGELTLVL